MLICALPPFLLGVTAPFLKPTRRTVARSVRL